MISSKQFFKYLQEPEQLTDSSVVEMEQLIKQFPFFQTAHLLYLQSLKKINTNHSPQQHRRRKLRQKSRPKSKRKP